MDQPLRRTCLLLSALVLAAATARDGSPNPPATAPADAPGATPSVYLRNLSLVGPDFQSGPDTLRFSNNGMGPGTRLALVVSRPSGGLIDFNSRAAHLTTFADDKGTDLLTAPKPPTGERPSACIGSIITDNGAAASVSIDSPRLPAKGARAITIRGVLVFRVATDQAAAEQADVPLAQGAEVTAGPYHLRIDELSKRDEPGNSAAVSLTLRAHQELWTIASITFLDPAGKEVPAFKCSWSNGGDGDNPQAYQTYNLARKPEHVTVRITYWSNPRNIQVPVDLTIGLGL
jgi:hypothetical protein